MYFVGRVFYTRGYIKGPNYRLVGAILCDLAFVGALVLSVKAVLDPAFFSKFGPKVVYVTAWLLKISYVI